MKCSRDQLLPYVIIQPCLHNRREMKVVCFGGRPLYVSTSSAKRSSDGINRSIPNKPHEKLFKFVEHAMHCYLTHCPYAILDGLFRVDVMQTKDGEYVVNEFESLEAAYYKGDYEEALVHTFLEKYWFEKLTSLSTEHALKNGID
jgi:hypothetical protein